MKKPELLMQRMMNLYDAIESLLENIANSILRRTYSTSNYGEQQTSKKKLPIPRTRMSSSRISSRRSRTWRKNSRVINPKLKRSEKTANRQSEKKKGLSRISRKQVPHGNLYVDWWLTRV